MENKLFISHASNDAPLAKLLHDFIRDSMQVSSDRIFCSSISGRIRAGDIFDRTIRENMEQACCVICLITRSFLDSRYCLMELGGGWFGNKTVVPLFVPPSKLEDLSKTPSKDVQSLFLTEEGMSSLYKILSELGLTYNPDILTLPHKIKEFLEQAVLVNVTTKGEDGYYRAYIEKIGTQNNHTFFKIDRLLLPHSFSEPSFHTQKEQHWLMVKDELLKNGLNFDCIREKDYVRFIITEADLKSKYFSSVTLNGEKLFDVRDIYVDQIKLA